MSDAPKKKHLDAATTRRIAVAADVDPMTVRRVLSGGLGNGKPHRSRERARDALVAAGYAVPEGDDE